MVEVKTMNFEEVKQMFKKSIDTADTMNQTIENLIQSIYLKGYNDALKEDWNCTACAHDGDSNICLECENGSKYFKLRNV